jgi:solute carrier family 25 phosphate transporter 23/24/25/41
VYTLVLMPALPPQAARKRLSEEKIRSLFNEIDTDRSGDITLAELQGAGEQSKLGPLCTLESCKTFLQLADTDGSNTLDFKEFKAWVIDRENVLTSLFHKLDKNKTGSVSSETFQHALVDMGCDISADQARHIIEKLDEDKSGTLEYEELLKAALIFPGNTAELINACFFMKGGTFLMYEDAETDEEIPALRILLAGTVSGFFARTLTAPQDRIAMNMRAGLISSNSSMISVAKTLVQRDGFRSLWVGNGVNCIKDGPRSGVTFLAYERYKPFLMKDPRSPTLLEKFMCGGLAGYTSMTLTYPLFVAQARIAVAEKGYYTGLADCLTKTVRVEGLRGLLRGYDAASLSVVPERGLSLMAYMTLRDLLIDKGQSPTLVQTLSCGAVSSFIAQTLTAPMQTVMVRTMVQGESFGRPVVYNNVFDCFRKIVFGDIKMNLRAEGYRALFRGLPAHLMKMIPGTAIQFAAFEYFSEKMQPYTG